VRDFEIFQSAGCRKVSALGYTESEWSGIRGIFEPAPITPEAELERIKIAVAAMEQINGAKNGTSGDAPKNDRHLGTGNQLDCIAEAANTTVALLLLHKEGLLRHHRIGHPQHRGFCKAAYLTLLHPFMNWKWASTTQSTHGSLKTASIPYACR
jgi:hypothetical protein